MDTLLWYTEKVNFFNKILSRMSAQTYPIMSALFVKKVGGD